MALSTLLVLNVSVNHRALDISEKNSVSIQYVSGLLAKVTLDDMFKKANAIVIGEVVACSEPFKIQGVGGGTMIFTDYEIAPHTTLRGDFADGETLLVRVQGGQIDNEQVICEEEPTLNTGEEYLFFLKKPNIGGGFNTSGDYYRILGVNQGLFEPEGNGMYQSYTGESIDISTLPSTLADDLPAEDAQRQQILSNLQSNLASGFITQEEYDRLVSELDQYATIIK